MGETEVVERKSAGPSRDPLSCSAHVHDGEVLLLTLSQHHLTVILSIFSTVAIFWYLVLLTRRRKHRIDDEDDVEEGEVEESQDALRRKSDELERCQDCVGYIDLCFGLFQLTGFLVLQYLPQLIQGESTEGEYVWTYLGQWHVAAFLKTLWFIVTMVTNKSSLYRICHNVSVKYFKTSQRPFNIIAFYMIVTSYLLLPLVIDILTYYTLPARFHGYGACVEMLKMSPLCLVVIIFYGAMIVTSIVLFCIRWFREGGASDVVARTTRHAYDDEPVLLSDDEEELIPADDDDDEDDVTDPSGVKNTDANSSNAEGNQGNNYLRNITENQEFSLEGNIKTIDEVVGYQNRESCAEEEIKIVEKRNKRHKLRIVAMAVLEPLLLWLWVVVVLHGNAGMSYSSNVDYGSMTLLWTIVAGCYTIVSACLRGSK